MKVMRLTYISKDISSVSYSWQSEELITYFRVRELVYGAHVGHLKDTGR